MSTARWVVRTADLKALVEKNIPQLMKDLEGGQYEAVGAKGEMVGWRSLLSDRMNLIRPCTKADSYARRIYQVIALDYQVMDADLADTMCLAMGYNMSEVMETFPKTVAACKERVAIEYEIKGEPLPKAKLEEEARKRFAQYEKEMYPKGQITSPYQERDKEYRRKRRAAEKAARQAA